jgi:hypothetical protein
VDPETLRLLISVSAAFVAALTTGVLAYKLGRRAAREEARQELELSSIADTRDQLLDLIGLLEAVIHRDMRKAQAALARQGEQRYPRARPELIADPELVTAISDTVLRAYENLLRMPADLAERVDDVPGVIRRAMRDQELRVRTGHPPMMMNGAQREVMKATITRIKVTGERYRGLGAAWLGIRMLVGF